MKKYRKILVAVIGLAAIVGNDFLGLDVNGAIIADSVLAVLTAFGVFQLPNAQA